MSIMTVMDADNDGEGNINDTTMLNKQTS